MEEINMLHFLLFFLLLSFIIIFIAILSFVLIWAFSMVAGYHPLERYFDYSDDFAYHIILWPYLASLGCIVWGILTIYDLRDFWYPTDFGAALWYIVLLSAICAYSTLALVVIRETHWYTYTGGFHESVRLPPSFMEELFIKIPAFFIVCGCGIILTRVAWWASSMPRV
jgi:hypothetical protein